jgi:hypothetical protein
MACTLAQVLAAFQVHVCAGLVAFSLFLSLHASCMLVLV